MNFFFDLDGTLVRSAERVHRAFLEVAQPAAPDFRSYWEWKRQGLSNAEILKAHFGFQDAHIKTIAARFLDVIESPALLDLDVLYPETPDALDLASRHGSLFVLTARQHADRASSQLARLGILRRFTRILVTGGKAAKSDLAREHVGQPAECVFITDTGADVDQGKRLDILTVAVSNGFRSAEVLSKYAPGHIAGNVLEAVTFAVNTLR